MEIVHNSVFKAFRRLTMTLWNSARGVLLDGKRQLSAELRREAIFLGKPLLLWDKRGIIHQKLYYEILCHLDHRAAAEGNLAA